MFIIVYFTRCDRQGKTEPKGSVSYLLFSIFGVEKVLVFLQLFTGVGDFNSAVVEYCSEEYITVKPGIYQAICG